MSYQASIKYSGALLISKVLVSFFIESVSAKVIAQVTTRYFATLYNSIDFSNGNFKCLLERGQIPDSACSVQRFSEM